MDEGGGYYDSGYIQPVDFFGDGTRIPLLIVSPYSTGGIVNHSYGDHVSIIKFIERNWGLSPLTARSRDNDPNPKAAAGNPYVPTEQPGDRRSVRRLQLRYSGRLVETLGDKPLTEIVNQIRPARDPIPAGFS